MSSVLKPSWSCIRIIMPSDSGNWLIGYSVTPSMRCVPPSRGWHWPAGHAGLDEHAIFAGVEGVAHGMELADLDTVDDQHLVVVDCLTASILRTVTSFFMAGSSWCQRATAVGVSLDRRLTASKLVPKAGA